MSDLEDDGDGGGELFEGEEGEAVGEVFIEGPCIGDPEGVVVSAL